ncbi:MAG: 3-deoxy-D-manno-octulosonic acid transferase [Deltaproteobacteria bacterium]
MIILYNILFSISIVLALPLIFVMVLTSEKRQKTVVQRLRPEACIRASGARPVWIHALSVGEVLASSSLIKQIKKTYAQRPVVLSVSTLTGHEVAKQRLKGDVDAIFFFPYDLLWSVRKTIGSVNPGIFILVESDIWPNFTYEVKRKHIPFILVNGRVSPRSFSGYMRLSFFMKRVFFNISSICAQTEMDARRFVALGAAPDKVLLTGNIKFDQPLISVSEEEVRALRASMRIGRTARVFVAGSTHEGEESILLRCLEALKRNAPDLVLVVVPRDPGRAGRVQGMFKQAGFIASLRTELGKMDVGFAPEAIIVDTIGELRRLYAIAHVVFVGKSLINLGGQNPLEPAALKKPIVFGPYMFNFAVIAERLVQEGGALQVANEDELLREVGNLLADPERLNTMGNKAYEVFRMNRGAVEETLAVIKGFL